MTDLGSLGPVRLQRLPFMPKLESERSVVRFSGRPIGEPCPPDCKVKAVHFHVIERLSYTEEAVR